MKIKLTLDEKYKNLVFQVSNTPIIENTDLRKICKNEKEHIEELACLWFDMNTPYNIIKVIERIHSADEIEWIATKYNWRFKSKKIYARYISSRYAKITFFKLPFADNIMTESEFKKLLEGTGLPFEAFEKVEAYD